MGREEPLGATTHVCLFIAHVIVSLIWTAGSATAQFRVLWFLSGILYFTHGCTTILLLSMAVQELGMRMERIALSGIRFFMKRIEGVLVDQAARAAFHTITKDVEPTMNRFFSKYHVIWNPIVTVGLLVHATLALPLLCYYLGAVVVAKLYPTGTSSYYSQRLAEELWGVEYNGCVVLLTLIVVTMVLHLVDIVCAAIMYAHHAKKEEGERGLVEKGSSSSSSDDSNSSSENERARL
jgi:hypothetical protein